MESNLVPIRTGNSVWISHIFLIPVIDPLDKMPRLSNECKAHLETALDSTDPSEKDFHIRQVLQAGGFED